MLLRDKVNTDIAAAMKSKDAARLSALRMLKAAIMNKGVEKAHDLDDAEVLQVVSTLVKQRRDSIEQFAKAGRTDLVDKETAEIAVLEGYLPPAASAAEIDAAIAEAIAETGATPGVSSEGQDHCDLLRPGVIRHLENRTHLNHRTPNRWSVFGGRWSGNSFLTDHRPPITGHYLLAFRTTATTRQRLCAESGRVSTIRT